MVTLFDVDRKVRSDADRLRLKLLLRGSHHESRLITWIHRAGCGLNRATASLWRSTRGLEAHFDYTARCNQALRPLRIEPQISDQHNGSEIRRHSHVSPGRPGYHLGFPQSEYRRAINGLDQVMPS
jgi:3-dehydroquinate dehydratase